MARSKNTASRAAHSAAGTAPDPAPAAVAPPAGGSPAAAVLAALSAHPAGAAVAVIAAHAGISVPATRQALLAHEKAGAATRIKGGRPGIPDTWTPEAPPAEAPGAGSTPSSGQPADAGQAVPAATGGEADAGAGPVPDPVAEAAGNIQALTQAVGEASKALAAGDLPAALAALEAARDQATVGRRAIKAAASGQRTPRGPAWRAARAGRSPPAQVPRHGLHPTPGRQGTDPLLRRGRKRPGQAGRPRHRADGLRQAAQLPARPRRPRTGRGRRPRGQRGGHTQRRVTRGTRPGPASVAVPAACRPASRRPGTCGRSPAGRPPQGPAGYLAGTRQVPRGTPKGDRRYTGPPAPGRRVFLPLQHLSRGRSEKGPSKPDFCR